MSETQKPAMPGGTESLTRHEILRTIGLSFCMGLGGIGLIGSGLVGAALIFHDDTPTSDYRPYTYEEPQEIPNPYEKPGPFAQSCIDLFNSSPQPDEYGAKDCISYHDLTRIALVNYALEPAVAEELAQEVEQEIVDQTRGVVHVDITPITASPEAQMMLATTLVPPENCLPQDEMGAWSSAVAARVMPELAGYDAVVGINDYTTCNQRVAGIADSLSGQAEVFDVIDHDTGKIQDAAVSVVGHEALHWFGVGHEGTMSNHYITMTADGQALARSSSNIVHPLHASTNEGPIDISDWIDGGTHIVYKGPSIMSHAQELEGTSQLNIAHQYALERPERALGRKTSTLGFDLRDRQVTFRACDQPSKVAVYDLGREIASERFDVSQLGVPRTTDEAGSPKPAETYFDKLLFASPSSGNAYGNSVELYALDESSGDVALLGNLWPERDERTTYVMNVSETRSILITMNPAGGTITVSSQQMSPQRLSVK